MLSFLGFNEHANECVWLHHRIPARITIAGVLPLLILVGLFCFYLFDWFKGAFVYPFVLPEPFTKSNWRMAARVEPPNFVQQLAMVKSLQQNRTLVGMKLVDVMEMLDIENDAGPRIGRVLHVGGDSVEIGIDSFGLSLEVRDGVVVSVRVIPVISEL